MAPWRPSGSSGRTPACAIVFVSPPIRHRAEVEGRSSGLTAPRTCRRRSGRTSPHPQRAAVRPVSPAQGRYRAAQRRPDGLAPIGPIPQERDQPADRPGAEGRPGDDVAEPSAHGPAPGGRRCLAGGDRGQLGHDELEDRRRRRAGRDAAVPVAEQPQRPLLIRGMRLDAEHDLADLAPGDRRHVALERGARAATSQSSRSPSASTIAAAR